MTDAVTHAGGLDIVVNNAGNAGPSGFGVRARFAESDPAQWEPFLRVNLYGVLYCTRAVLPGMESRGWGQIITIISDAGRTGDAYGAAYGVSKAGAAGLAFAVTVLYAVGTGAEAEDAAFFAPVDWARRRDAQAVAGDALDAAIAGVLDAEILANLGAGSGVSSENRIKRRLRKNHGFHFSSSISERSGRGTVCPANSCVQSPRNWIFPSVTKE